MARALVPNLPYDPVTDFIPITTTALTEMVAVVPPSLGVEDVQGFIALAKSKPGELAYKSAGQGSNSHLFAAWFTDAAGLDMIHIPYKGSGDSIPDLLAGVTQLGFDTLPAVIADVIAEFPDALLSTHTGVSAEIMDLVARGQVDIGVVALQPGRNDLALMQLPASEAVCILPRQHPLAPRPLLEPADLHGQDYVALSSGSLMRMELHALLHRAGAHPRQRVESLFAATVAEYVACGLGLAMVDPLTARGADPARTVVRRFVPQIRYELSVIYAPGTGESPILDRLQTILTHRYQKAIAETERLLAA